jgi:cytochrome P450
VTTTTPDVFYDMYDREIFASPYETYRRLRDDAPLYYNEERDFYAVSRADDVNRVLSERDTFSSAKGPVYNIIKSGFEVPRGLFIGEDPPLHTVHRALVSRLFTPRAISRIEDEIHELFETSSDALVGSTRIDFMQDFAVLLPIQVIGMLFGLPKSDYGHLHATFHRSMNEATADEESDAFAGILEVAVLFTEYLDERIAHPTDDLLTELLQMEFEDETGTTRRLERDEIVTYLSLIVGAGSDTTATGLGWAASLLGDHPDQRRRLQEDPGLLASAVEEVLRCEPPSYHIGRVTTRDVEIHGQVVPAGSTIVSLPGAANRDDRHLERPDEFDIGRPPSQIYTFSFGPHFCLGASLAKLEIRVALEAFMKRFPDWTVDHDAAELLGGIDTRGWNRLPIEVG